LHELEAFSSQEAQSCRQLLAMSDVSCLYLEFDEEDGGADVTNDNVKQYIRLRAEKEIVGQRRGRLEAMRKGFSDLPLGPHLRLFSVFDLMSLVCGKQELTSEELLERIKFTGYNRRSQTPTYFRNMIRNFSNTLRLRFLSFVTASTALPRKSTNSNSHHQNRNSMFGDSDEEEECSGMITIKYVPWGSHRFPLAHTCFDRLDLPEYESEAILSTKLTWCLDNLEMSGFGES